MDKPLVSVVMTVFNGERLLREAVESVLGQSFPDFEFVIVDDGSTDSAPSLLDYYAAIDPRVRVWHQENKGLVKSLSRGCALAEGKYIARMDADDLTVKDRLMWQVEYMEANPEVGVLGGAMQVMDDAGKPLAIWQYPSQSGQIKDALLRHRRSIAHATVVMRKEVFVSVGGYRSIFTGAEDYDLWLRMAERCELANLQAVLYKYRLHPDQKFYRNVQRQVSCGLAAQAAALIRRNGLPDPLNSVKEITPAVLAALGITEMAVEKRVIARYRDRIILLRELSRDLPILPLVNHMLAKLAESKHVRPPVAAGVWGVAARAYWSRGKVLKAVAAAARAFLVHPALPMDIVRREFGRLLRWAGLRARLPR